jgi:hypothetical protein
LEDSAAWIHLLAGLSQPSRIDFDGHIVLFGGGQKALEERTAILPRVKAEFLWEIRVADDLKELRLRRLG